MRFSNRLTRTESEGCHKWFILTYDANICLHINPVLCLQGTVPTSPLEDWVWTMQLSEGHGTSDNLKLTHVVAGHVVAGQVVAR